MAGDKADKAKMNVHLKHIPKDAQVVMSILKELNIVNYEPRIINQLLDFIYRFTTCVLDDAKVYANHARKKTIDLEDVKLATEMVLDKCFTGPPPRHVLSKLSESMNSKPLPAIKSHTQLRLPPDRHCLLNCNYKLRTAYSPRKMTKSAFDGRPPPNSVFNIPKRQPPVPPKTQVINIPKPVIKFTTITRPSAQASAAATTVLKMEPGVEQAAGQGGATVINMDTEEKMDVDIEPKSVGDGGIIKTEKSSKREREDEDFDAI